MSQKQENKTRKKRDYKEDDRGLLEDILDFIKVFAASAVVIFLFVSFIAYPVTVSGHSMDPALADGEYGFTSVFSATFSKPERGDIVVINMENADGNTDRWVKRVIGLPGETIECTEGQIYIDGTPLDESAYLSEETKDAVLRQYQAEFGVEYGNFNSDFDAVTLGEDEYFVMGDNRVVSKDSRDPEVGPISGSSIFGQGMLVLYPFDKMGVK